MSAIILAGPQAAASKFTLDTFLDNIDTAAYRNFVETKADFRQGMRTDTGASGTSFFQHNANNTRYLTAVTGFVGGSEGSWATIPSKWKAAKGSTLVFMNSSYSPTSNQDTVTDATFNGNSITLTDQSPSSYVDRLYISNKVAMRYYTHSSDSSTYDLSGATIGATFNKRSQNGFNSQTIVGLPGKWDVIETEAAVHSVAGQSYTTSTSFQAGDVILLQSGEVEDSAVFFDMEDSGGNATRRGSTRRGNWYEAHNFELYTVDSAGTVTWDGTTQDGLTYIALRFAG